LDVNTHDQWAVESPGPIHDRTLEHLGTSDVGIVKYRKLLLAAIRDVQGGERAPFSLTPGEAARTWGPVAVDAIGPQSEQAECWQRRDRERRQSSSWAQPREAS
jgi:hypothetical protein